MDPVASNRQGFSSWFSLFNHLGKKTKCSN
jgi:hypothetical protein